ncbi:hypothetical protein M758_2G165600 [Ceratodon purpureus]|nr:hypothetical protein M758_2G165600 [Ceratodon purpureus]
MLRPARSGPVPARLSPASNACVKLKTLCQERRRYVEVECFRKETLDRDCAAKTCAPCLLGQVCLHTFRAKDGT